MQDLYLNSIINIFIISTAARSSNMNIMMAVMMTAINQHQHLQDDEIMMMMMLDR